MPRCLRGSTARGKSNLLPATLSLKQVPIVGSAAMLYYKHVRKLSMRLRELEAEAQAFAQARLANVRTVRAFANEKLEAERFQQVHLTNKQKRA